MCAVEHVSDELIIKNRLGLHARAAAKLVKAAGRFKAEVEVWKDDQRADAKSVLSLISLGCPYASRVRVAAFGEDSQEAVQALSLVIDERFGEE